MHNVQRLEGLLSTILPFGKKSEVFQTLSFAVLHNSVFGVGNNGAINLFNLFNYDFRKAFYLSF